MPHDEAAKAPATGQPVECTPFKSGDTHCGDCPCRYGKHIREPKLDNLNRQDAIEDLFYAMRALFGDAYQPSRTQAETLLNTLLEKLDFRSTKREYSPLSDTEVANVIGNAWNEAIKHDKSPRMEAAIALREQFDIRRRG